MPGELFRSVKLPLQIPLQVQIAIWWRSACRTSTWGSCASAAHLIIFRGKWVHQVAKMVSACKAIIPSCSGTLFVRSAVPLGSSVIMLILTHPDVMLGWRNCWQRSSGTDVSACERKSGWIDWFSFLVLLSGPGQLLFKPENFPQSVCSSNVVQYSHQHPLSPPDTLQIWIQHCFNKRLHNTYATNICISVTCMVMYCQTLKIMYMSAVVFHVILKRETLFKGKGFT